MLRIMWVISPKTGIFSWAGSIRSGALPDRTGVGLHRIEDLLNVGALPGIFEDEGHDGITGDADADAVGWGDSVCRAGEGRDCPQGHRRELQVAGAGAADHY